MLSHISILWTLLTLAVASAVQELTTDTFDQFVRKNELVLVSFVAPWCQFCQELEPRYEAAAEVLLAEGIPVASVDCVIQESLCLDQKIPIYPSIFSFQNGERREYHGRRNTEAIIAYVRRLLEPAVTFLSHAREMVDFRAKDNITIFGYFDQADDESKALFADIAMSYHGSHSFASIEDDTFGAIENVQKPAIVLYKPFDYGRSLYTDKFEATKITEFLEDARMPLIREVGVDLDSLRPGHPLPYALLFSEANDQRRALINSLLPLVQVTDDNVAWFVIDPNEYPEYLDRVGFNKSRKSWPAFGIEDVQNDFNFALSTENAKNEVTPRALERLLQKFFAGKLEKTQRDQSSLLKKPETVAMIDDVDVSSHNEL